MNENEFTPHEKRVILLEFIHDHPGTTKAFMKKIITHPQFQNISHIVTGLLKMDLVFSRKVFVKLHHTEFSRPSYGYFCACTKSGIPWTCKSLELEGRRPLSMGGNSK